jgi:hypothetical protein
LTLKKRNRKKKAGADLGLGWAVSFFRSFKKRFGQFRENKLTNFLFRAILWVNFFHTFVFVSGRLEGGLSPFTLLFLCYKRIFRGFFGSMILFIFWVWHGNLGGHL